MSAASKCDRCGALFAHAKGCVTLEAVHVVSKSGPDNATCSTWSDLDFCPACSVLVLDVIGKAMGGLRRPR